MVKMADEMLEDEDSEVKNLSPPQRLKGFFFE